MLDLPGTNAVHARHGSAQKFFTKEFLTDIRLSHASVDQVSVLSVSILSKPRRWMPYQDPARISRGQASAARLASRSCRSCEVGASEGPRRS